MPWPRMITSMPHKTSPLTILDHRFLEVLVKTNEAPSEYGQYDLVTRAEIFSTESDPLKWQVLLEVAFGPRDTESPTPYTGKVVVSGFFRILESFTETNREALIRVSAASILYGSSREMVANITARSIHGILSLPSISFRKEKPEEENG